MNKRNLTIIGVVIVLVVAGAFIALHMSKTSANTAAKQANAPASNGTVVVTKTSPTLGQYLTDPSGKALYTSSADTSGVSNCTGSCLAAWPAYIDSGATTGLQTGVGTIKRTDNGKSQYTYNGMPLYYFASDTAGNATGDGISGFHLAKPSAQSAASSATPTPAQTAAPAATPTPQSAYSQESTPAVATTPVATPTPAPAPW